MKKLLLLMTAVFVSPLAQAVFADINQLTVWDTSPAHRWSSECYPIGNGRLGAMPFGGANKEQIQYNEDTLWIGDEKLTGSYQNFGDIYIELGHAKVGNYVRKLDLRHAVESIRYNCNGVAYKREYFASMVDNVMVFRFSADKKSAYDAVISVSDAHKGKISVENGNTIVSTGNLKGWLYKGEKSYDQFLDYESRIMVVNDGGTLSKNGNTLSIKGADGFTLFVVAGTNFKQDPACGWHGEPPHARLMEILKDVSSKKYADILAKHMSAYDKIFSRLSINLGTTDKELLDKTTSERLEAYKKKAKDPDLEEMLFQYARYLMIGSSRIGGLPSNLQGLWNNSNNPPWASDFHSDVNIEMNYWFVDMDNLSDCFLPLAAWLKSTNPVRLAETHNAFNTRGWLTHGANGVFGGSTWLWSKGDSAWMMQNLWDHYQFTLDKDYLENYAYPLMKGVCEFWQDNLKKLPDGTLVSPKGYSPEHGPHEDGVSFDQELVWNLFDDFIAASKVLDKDDKFRQEVIEMHKHLLVPKIGKWGQLQEWMVDRDSPKDRHRHLSHMIAIHPGHQMSPRTTPELAAAARVSMNARGDGATGWSKAWKINVWARLQDGNRAYKLLNEFISHNVYNNLFGFHPPFQIDCNFGYASGLSEMLLQSHMGYIELLPALPDAWPQGYIRGIKARGAFVLDIEWSKSKFKTVNILSQKGSLCRIYSSEELVVTKGRRKIKTKRDGNVVSFKTKKGKSYRVKPAKNE